MIVNIERKPTLSLYYIGGLVLNVLLSNSGEHIESLYQITKETMDQELHIDFFYYALDWLFLLSKIKLENGRIYLCKTGGSIYANSQINS